MQWSNLPTPPKTMCLLFKCTGALVAHLVEQVAQSAADHCLLVSLIGSPPPGNAHLISPAFSNSPGCLCLFC